MVIFANQPPAESAGRATGWWEMGSRFREGGTTLDPAHLLILLAVVIAISILLWFLSRVFQRESNESLQNPRRLFRELCRAHQLTYSESWLLWRLAQAKHLTQPALVFIDQRHLDGALLPSDWQDAKPRLAELRERLFC